jgi:hypothetical protein
MDPLLRAYFPFSSPDENWLGIFICCMHCKYGFMRSAGDRDGRPAFTWITESHFTCFFRSHDCQSEIAVMTDNEFEKLVGLSFRLAQLLGLHIPESLSIHFLPKSGDAAITSSYKDGLNCCKSETRSAINFLPCSLGIY